MFPIPDLHIYQGLSQLSPDAAEEAKRHGDLEEEAVDHDEMADTHVTPEDVPGGHHHDAGQGRTVQVPTVRQCYICDNCVSPEDKVLTKVQSCQGLRGPEGGLLVLCQML